MESSPQPHPNPSQPVVEPRLNLGLLLPVPKASPQEVLQGRGVLDFLLALGPTETLASLHRKSSFKILFWEGSRDGGISFAHSQCTSFIFC